MLSSISGVGVLDKAVAVLDALAAKPSTLNELMIATGLPRATAYRLATALELHRLVARDIDGRFRLGGKVAELARGGVGVSDLAPSAVAALRDVTGESAQAYVRQGDQRVCVAAAERPTGLRDSVPVGAVLPLTAGSAAQVFLAWAASDERVRLLGLAAFTDREVGRVRRRGWAESVGERESGVASVSAPVIVEGQLIAAISVSGPIDRLGRAPGRRFATAVVSAAGSLAGLLSAKELS